MFPAKAVVIRFSLIFACAFALLSVPFAPLADAYSGFVSELGNGLVEFRTFDSGAKLRFEPGADVKPEPGKEVEHWQSVLFVEKGKTAKLRIPIDLRSLGYLPLAAFIALAVATPITLRRKLRVLGSGLLVLVPLTLLLLASALALMLAGGLPIQVVQLTPAVELPLALIQRALVSPPGMTYAIPVLLWWALLWLTRAETAAEPAGSGRLHLDQDVVEARLK